MRLSEVVSISERLAKSANVERDSSRTSFESYIITGRVQDVLRQFVRGMENPKAGRAFSITGPYGTGKSSFAVFLSALFGDLESREFIDAINHLKVVDLNLADSWVEGRRRIQPSNNALLHGENSPLRSFGTAEREPLVWTIAKSLVRDVHPADLELAGICRSDLEKPIQGKIDAASLKRLILSIATRRPVVLLIDEFGKNLQTFGETGAAGDPYLLQELAEASQGVDALPIFIVTMQHLAFDEYVSELGNVQRREWSKIQGRFHDVGFVESSEQTHFLIASAFTRKESTLDKTISDWYSGNKHKFREIVDPKLAEAAYPLHPLAMAALPELCNRYGQNERTLFSFLAGDEPKTLRTLIAEREVGGNELTFIGLCEVYEYFLGAAASFIAASNSASRWLEIELRLRDYQGQLSQLDENLLKSIAVLNLVSAGGALRASQDNILSLATQDYGSPEAVQAALNRLAKESVITYRDFADEWRIWKGSDFDVRSSIEAARMRSQALTPFELLEDFFDAAPLVAGRSSQTTGILRVFSQKLTKQQISVDCVARGHDAVDGVVLLGLSDEWIAPTFPAGHLPVLVGEATDPESIRVAAIEAYSTASALSEAKRRVDEVAFNELSERLAIARLKLQLECATQWSSQSSKWTLIVNNTPVPVSNERTMSEMLSKVTEKAYPLAPTVSNEMISRRDLTSQGSMARRLLAEALIKASTQPELGLAGFGPEVSIYKAVFQATGIHKVAESGIWELSTPIDESWKPIWKALDEVSHSSIENRTNLVAFENVLSSAPFGLKAGLIWLLVVAYLEHGKDDIAVYEYGSLVLTLDDAVIERMLKNPGVFSIRMTGVSFGARSQIVSILGDKWQMPGGSDVKFMTLVRQLSRLFMNLPPYVFNVKKNLDRSTKAVIEVFKSAPEPDQLVFVDIPEALGLYPISVDAQPLTDEQIKSYVNGLASAVNKARSLYEELLNEIDEAVGTSFGVIGTLAEKRVLLSAEAETVAPETLNANLASLSNAFGRKHISDIEWLANLAMIMTDGLPPRQWNDESISIFKNTIRDWSRAWIGVTALAGNEGAHSRAVTLTLPDGTSETRVVDLSHTANQEAKLRVKALIEALAAGGVSKQMAAAAVAAIALNENVSSMSDNQDVGKGA
jgi:hypothetical protein